MSKSRERRALCPKDAASELGIHVETLRTRIRRGLVLTERKMPGARADVVLERSELTGRWLPVPRRGR